MWKCFREISVSNNDIQAGFLPCVIGFNVKALLLEPKFILLFIFQCSECPEEITGNEELIEENNDEENANQDADEEMCVDEGSDKKEDKGVDNDKEKEKEKEKDKDEDKGRYMRMRPILWGAGVVSHRYFEWKVEGIAISW